MVIDEAKALQAEGAVSARPAAAASEAFERVSRAVRRTVLLVQRLGEPVAVRGARSAEEQRATDRRRMLRGVEDAIHERAEGYEVERLRAEMLERLDGPDIEDELLDRSVEEVVRIVCRDLGITAMRGQGGHKPRTPVEVAAMCERARARPAANDARAVSALRGVRTAAARDLPRVRGP